MEPVVARPWILLIMRKQKVTLKCVGSNMNLEEVDFLPCGANWCASKLGNTSLQVTQCMNFGNVIPALGGSHNFEKQDRKRELARAVQAA